MRSNLLEELLMTLWFAIGTQTLRCLGKLEVPPIDCSRWKPLPVRFSKVCNEPCLKLIVSVITASHDQTFKEKALNFFAPNTSPEGPVLISHRPSHPPEATSALVQKLDAIDLKAQHAPPPVVERIGSSQNRPGRKGRRRMDSGEGAQIVYVQHRRILTPEEKEKKSEKARAKKEEKQHQAKAEKEARYARRPHACPEPTCQSRFVADDTTMFGHVASKHPHIKKIKVGNRIVGWQLPEEQME